MPLSCFLLAQCLCPGGAHVCPREPAPLAFPGRGPLLHPRGHRGRGALSPPPASSRKVAGSRPSLSRVLCVHAHGAQPSPCRLLRSGDHRSASTRCVPEPPLHSPTLPLPETLQMPCARKNKTASFPQLSRDVSVPSRVRWRPRGQELAPESAGPCSDVREPRRCHASAAVPHRRQESRLHRDQTVGLGLFGFTVGVN